MASNENKRKEHQEDTIDLKDEQNSTWAKTTKKFAQENIAPSYPAPTPPEETAPDYEAPPAPIPSAPPQPLTIVAEPRPGSNPADAQPTFKLAAQIAGYVHDHKDPNNGRDYFCAPNSDVELFSSKSDANGNVEIQFSQNTEAAKLAAFQSCHQYNPKGELELEGTSSERLALLKIAVEKFPESTGGKVLSLDESCFSGFDDADKAQVAVLKEKYQGQKLTQEGSTAGITQARTNEPGEPHDPSSGPSRGGP